MIYPVIKITIDDIKNTDFTTVNPAIYEIFVRGYKYEILVNVKNNYKKAVVFGTGAVDRSKSLPRFNRCSWADDIDATCIYYSDPTLYKTEQVRLCWCYGDNSDWCLKTIAHLITKILVNLSISLDNTLFFGSSGGGFTAMALATILRGRATVINPQFFARNTIDFFDSFKETVNYDDTNLIESRIDILELIKSEGYLAPIHLIINFASERDFEFQYKPFVEKMYQNGFNMPLYNITEYYNERGHNGMPSKEKCIQIIENDLTQGALIVKLQKALKYTDCLIMPNGMIAQIGEKSNAAYVLHEPQESKKNEYNFQHVIYPVFGSYFCRSNYGTIPQLDTWKYCKSGYDDNMKHHADDLSFMLYSKGYEIFTDSGSYNSNSDIYRAYFASALAHNTVIVDEDTYPFSYKHKNLIGIRTYDLCSVSDYVSMYNYSYENVKIRRDFCSNGDLTVLIDCIESNNYHRYSQLFHLAECISVVCAEDNYVKLKIADTGFFVNIIQINSPCRLSVINGNENIPLYGLISRVEDHIDTITTLKFETLSCNAEYITIIAISDDEDNVRLDNEFCKLSDIHFDRLTYQIIANNVALQCSYTKINMADIVISTATEYRDNKLHFLLKIREQYRNRIKVAYYLYKDNEILERRMYQDKLEQSFDIKCCGNYRVKYYIDNGKSKKHSMVNTLQ